MIHTIDFYGRFLITASILLQLVYMRYTNSAYIFPLAFYLYGIGCYMVSYTYYAAGGVVTLQSFMKALNGTLLILIGAYASTHNKK